ncbi:MAG: beta-ketoacyl-ACP synthase III [Burkholderiales bacterium]
MTLYSRILGTGSHLPARRVSNADLAAQLAQDGVETSDAWIQERTGIQARYFADGLKTSDLALPAAQRALEAAGLGAEQLDLIIVATTTPDMVFPSTACLLQAKLGVSGCAAFDVQAVCSGFLYALSVADAMIRAGNARHALVVGAEVFSALLDFKDRGTCVLFGDGAGAVVLGASAEPGILATALHADGRQAGVLCVPDRHVLMDGQAVFKLAVGALEKAALEVLEKADRTAASIDWLIPHQANLRIMKGTCKKLGLPEERMVVTVHEHGNTSAASVPLALDTAVRDGRIQRGQSLMLEGVGGGFTWGAALVVY